MPMKSSPRRRAVSGVWGDGFIITALPNAREIAA